MKKQLLPLAFCFAVLFLSTAKAEEAQFQKAGPLLSFGLNKDQMQLSLFASHFSGNKQHFTSLEPNILYGLSNDLSLLLNLPVAISNQKNQQHSNGLEDASLIAEYAFYSNKSMEYSDQATVVGGFAIPSGSSKKQPPTGFGAMSYFLGLTFNRSYADWFGFVSPGATLTTTHDKTRYGNQYLYQLGIGRNITQIQSNWLLAALLELNGQFSVKNSIHGVKDQNSGGNIVFATPSLSLANKSFITQLGFGLPITQHLYGNQTKTRYLLAANFSWTF